MIIIDIDIKEERLEESTVLNSEDKSPIKNSNKTTKFYQGTVKVNNSLTPEEKEIMDVQLKIAQAKLKKEVERGAMVESALEAAEILSPCNNYHSCDECGAEEVICQEELKVEPVTLRDGDDQTISMDANNVTCNETGFFLVE